MVQGKITEADTLTICLGATPSGLISDPSPSSTHFYARCPSCRNPPTLSWLGTGTKYAGLHTHLQAVTLIFLDLTVPWSLFLVVKLKCLNYRTEKLIIWTFCMKTKLKCDIIITIMMFMVLSSWQAIVRVHSVHLMSARGHKPSNQANQLRLWVHW